MRIFDLIINDLKMVVREKQSFLFLLIMPIGFTLMFGFAFGGFSSDESDPRLPLAFLDLDQGEFSIHLRSLLQGSELVRLEVVGNTDQAKLSADVADNDYAGALIVPAGYGAAMSESQDLAVTLIADGSTNAGMAIQREVHAAAMRLASARDAAEISAELYGKESGVAGTGAFYDASLAEAIGAWQDPPIMVEVRKSGAIAVEEENENAFTHSSPGMMGQFALAGVMGAATILVLERRSGVLRRLLTTNMTRGQVLFGHYLAMFVMTFIQLLILILFGQILLRLDYFGQPAATLLLAVLTAMFVASLGLLIASLSKSEEQTIVFSIIPMFVLSGIGGAWVPLEVTPPAFQQIARFTPLAWVIDGYKDILIRGQGLEAVAPSLLVLGAYAVVLFALAVWRFRIE